MAKSQSRDHWTTVPNTHWGLAQEMRKSPTRAEHELWQVLRGKKLGVSFRRQHPIGPYVADFICAELSLVIEVDGDVHDEPEQKAHDDARTEYVKQRGLRVARFTNEEVLSELDRVVAQIERIIESERRK